MRLAALLLALLSSSAGAVAAEPQEAVRIAATPPPRASVYQLNPAVDASVIAVSAAGVILPYAFRYPLSTRRCPCDPNEVNPIDRGVIGNANPTLGPVSDVTVGLALAAPVALFAVEDRWSRALLDDLVVYAEVLTVNGALVTFAKYAVLRPIPQSYADPNSDTARQPSGYDSFYSGHVSVTISSLTAASMTYTLRHGRTWWPWVATGAVGASVMLERVAAGQHFYTDVIFGAVAGLGVGTVIPLLHERAPLPNSELVPITGPEQVGLALRVRI